MPLTSFLNDSHDTISLHAGWTLSPAPSGHGAPEHAGLEGLPAAVPGCVHLDLLRSSVIPDPFIGRNEEEVAWVAKQDWIYRTRFHLKRGDLPDGPDAHRQLVCEGLDTVASITLDGADLAHTENMFVPHRIDLPDDLKPGAHDLEIRFHSPLKEIEKRVKEQGRAPSTFNDDRNWLRKASYSFGWDWGPTLPTSGIWRPIYLQGWRHGRVAWFTSRYEPGSRSGGRLHLRAGVRVDTEGEWVLRATLAREGAVFQGETGVGDARADAEVTVTLSIDVTAADLWWPHDLGEPALYTLTLSLDRNGKEVHNVSERIGLRTVDWVQETDAWGRSFMLRVNGRPVFAKGANWIPSDSFLPRVHAERYSRHLTLAREMGMNMLRVWGGGIYEDPVFYRTANLMGMMVWQDFPFACGLYPETPDFLETVRLEAYAAVASLARHPAVVLWCGNNEIERDAAKFGRWYGLGYMGESIWKELLPQVVRQIDPSAFYWQSSPDGGRTPDSSEEGDRHVWSVWSEWENESNYLLEEGRFISEFGFQAPPDSQTLHEVIPTGAWEIQHPLVEWHNKQIEGTERLVRFLAGRHHLTTDMDRFIRLAQDVQGRALRKAIEHWRRRRPRTMGALIWQLNDCWQVSSWSLIDYRKRLKAAYYHVRRAFAPRALTLLCAGRDIELWAINDREESWQTEIRLRTLRFSGETVREETFPVKVAGETATRLRLFPPASWINTPEEQMLLAEDSASDPENPTRALWFALPPKHLRLPGARIRVQPEERNGVPGVRARADAFALALWISDEQNPGLVFEDNALDLLPGEERWVASLMAVDGTPAESRQPTAWAVNEARKMRPSGAMP